MGSIGLTIRPVPMKASSDAALSTMTARLNWLVRSTMKAQ
jgi:hypothetical protein